VPVAQLGAALDALWRRLTAQKACGEAL